MSYKHHTLIKLKFGIYLQNNIFLDKNIVNQIMKYDMTIYVRLLGSGSSPMS